MQCTSFQHCRKILLVNNIKKNIIQDFLSNSSNCTGSETSSYNSECNDEEEIALAIQAAELASRNEARSRFRSSSDLIHRLFVCIAGKFLIIFVLNKILHFKMMANLMTLFTAFEPVYKILLRGGQWLIGKMLDLGLKCH